MPAIVAIIGRPNVGKSTLFNRILGKRVAIESPISGTTRDPITAVYEGVKTDVLFVDTGGLEFGQQEGVIEESIQKQARLAIEDADLILFCLDARQEITAGEQEAVSLLRKSRGKKQVLLVGTKAESNERVLYENDLYAFGITEHQPLFVAALQGQGMEELLARVEDVLEAQGFQKYRKPDEKTLHIAVLGRPNVGKSSLINALTKSEKLIVSEIAGTTRDSIDTEVKHEDKIYRLIDTAGIRRKSKIHEKLERYSVLRSLATLHRADVTILLLSAEDGVTHQDKYIIEHILEAKTALIIAINKSDLLEKGEESRKYFLGRLQRELDFIPWAPTQFISALEKKNIHKLFPLIERVAEERSKRITTGQLNAFLQEAQHLHPLSGVKNTRPRIKYGVQVEDKYPHFLLHGTRLNALHFSARRYLENRIRDAFGFEGTPIEMQMVTQRNPYHEAKSIRLPAEARKQKREEERREREGR